MLSLVARPATTVDVFTAIAEPRRRQIVELLVGGAERDVTELVLELGLPQPAVSKHLGVLRKVGCVAVQKAGRRRLYRLEPWALRPVEEWVRKFDRLWTDQLLEIKRAAERTARQPVAGSPAAADSKPLSKE